MTFDDFISCILGLMSRRGIESEVFFDNDTDLQRYEASIPEHGITIYGRPSGLSLTVRFGSGHQAMIRAEVFNCM